MLYFLKIYLKNYNNFFHMFKIQKDCVLIPKG